MESSFDIWSSFTITYENFTYKIISYYNELISHIKIPYMNFMISYMNKFHIWKFHIWNHDEIMISYMIWFHIWKFHIWNHDFIYDLISHMKISYMKSWFHIWSGFTYENFIYEIMISYVIWFHIWKFHIWNRDFIYDLVSPYENFIYEMVSSYMKWSIHIWNYMWNFRKARSCDISIRFRKLFSKNALRTFLTANTRTLTNSVRLNWRIQCYFCLWKTKNFSKTLVSYRLHNIKVPTCFFHATFSTGCPSRLDAL